MAAGHATNSPRGLFHKELIALGVAPATANLTGNSSGQVVFAGGVKVTTQVLTGNSTALFVAGGLALSGEATDIITQNSTGLKLAAGLYVSAQTTNPLTQNAGGYLLGLTAAPSGDGAGAIVSGYNTTGHYVKINSTGTTWVYLSHTVTQPPY